MEKGAIRNAYEKDKPQSKKVMENFLKRTKGIGLVLGITGTVLTASAYTDAEITKAVIENFEQAPEQQKDVNSDTTATLEDFEKIVKEEEKTQNKKIDVLGENDGVPFKIENGKLILTDTSSPDVKQSNLIQAVDYYNNIKNTNIYKDISLTAIEFILNDNSLSDDEKTQATVILFELSMKQFGYDLSRLGGGSDDETEVWIYDGSGEYISQAIKEMKSANPKKDNIIFPKKTTKIADNPQKIADNGDDLDDLDFDNIDLGFDKDNAELDQRLADAQKRLEESLTQGREKLIKAAKAYVATGGNPADVLDNWDELTKKYNITPDDL